MPTRRLLAIAVVAGLPLLLASCSRIYSNGHQFRDANAFAALKQDGSVVAWGSPTRGGDPSCVLAVSCAPAPAGSLSSGIVDIASSHGAFAAITSTGRVIPWGGVAFGGDPDCATGATCSPALSGSLVSGVARVFSTYQAFAALRADGSVVTWGETEFGGNSDCVATAGNPCSPAPAGSLASGVADVFGGYSAFAALRSDGSVVSWGSPAFGGDSSSPVGGTLTGIAGITPNGGAFAARTASGARTSSRTASSG